MCIRDRLHIGLNEGESAPVDSVLAIIGKKGTDISGILAAQNQPAAALIQAVTPEQTAAAKPEPVAPLAELKPAPQPVSQPIQTKSSNGRVIASPLAKKLAHEKGIDLARVHGSGDHGRIVKRDIDNYQPQMGGGIQSFTPRGTESVTELANSQMRKTIAKRLSASKFSAPHYYLGVEFDMDHAIAFRTQYNTLPDTKISFNDIVVKASALALKQHPQVNAKWEDHQITQHHHVHIGVAVAVEDGLVVPVVKFADEQSFPQLGAAVKDYAVRARDKKLKPEEMDDAIIKRLYRLYKKPMPEGVLPMNIQEFGNSSVATVPTLFDLIRKKNYGGHSLQVGDLIIFASVGAGMNINAITYRM